MSHKNTILFINSAPKDVFSGIRAYAKRIKKPLKIAVIRDSRKKKWDETANIRGVDELLLCELSKPNKIAKTLIPIHDRLLAVTCRGDSNIPAFTEVIPHVPYVRTPTTESLLVATDKIAMRRRLRTYDKKLTPRFAVITAPTKKNIQNIKDKIGFPLVIKPANLALSLLVSICFHKEELERTLKTSFRKIRRIYRENGRTATPRILVEQFMEGDMYSIDVYVNSRGRVYHCPLVHVKTGRAIGFDDFFGYEQMTPTMLSKKSVKAAEDAATKAVRALGLRTTTAHIELMKMERGWKIIEVGPRIGGFRHKLYQYAYGIDHALNDVLIRIPKKPHIPKRVRGYAVAMKFFAKNEGILTTLHGIKKIKKLSSFKEVKIHKKVGDRCVYAKNGGKSVCDVIMFNKTRQGLLADIRRIEQLIVIETKNTRG